MREQSHVLTSCWVKFGRNATRVRQRGSEFGCKSEKHNQFFELRLPVSRMETPSQYEESQARLAAKVQELNSANPVGVTVEVLVDAARLLNEIRFLVDSLGAQLDAKQASRIIASIARWTRNYSKRHAGRVCYSDSTVDEVTKLFVSVAACCSKATLDKSPKSKRRSRERISHLAEESLEILFTTVKSSADEYSWRHPFIFLDAMYGNGSANISRIVESSRWQEVFEHAERELLAALEKAVSLGEVNRAEAIMTAVRRRPALLRQTSDKLTYLLRENAPRLPTPSQNWLLQQLGISSSESSIEYADPSDAPEIKQAASLLLLLWDYGHDSSKFREAFEQFESLCERHFHLFLRGETGTFMSYDARVHECSPPCPPTIRLLRPWVEWFKPPNARVIIRGLAEPGHSES